MFNLKHDKKIPVWIDPRKYWRSIYLIGETHPVHHIKWLRPKFFRHVDFLDKSQWWTPKKLRFMQLKKLKKIVLHAYNEVPYYRKVMKQHKLLPSDIKELKDITKIPLTEKDGMRPSFPKEIVSQSYPDLNLMSDSTSGSTGTPFQFFKCPEKVEWEKSLDTRTYSWIGMDRGDRFAKIWGVKNPNYWLSLGEKLIRKRIILNAFEMNKGKTTVFFKQLEKFQPDFLQGYGGALYVFSKFMSNENLSLPSLRGVISSGGMMLERELQERSFGCPVYDRYGSREFGCVAHECEFKNLHVNDEGFLVELVDEEGNWVEDGERGEIVVTDFNNPAMPFIRYKIGDSAKANYQKKCECGRGLSILGELLGRTSDLIYTPSGKPILLQFFVLLFQKNKKIKKFKLVKTSKRKLDVFLEVEKKLEDSLIEEIERKIVDYCQSEMDVEIVLVDELPFSESGKYKIIESRIAT